MPLIMTLLQGKFQVCNVTVDCIGDIKILKKCKSKQYIMFVCLK